MARRVVDPKTGFIQFIQNEDEKKLKALERDNQDLIRKNEDLKSKLEALEERLEKAGI